MLRDRLASVCVLEEEFFYKKTDISFQKKTQGIFGSFSFGATVPSGTGPPHSRGF
jgi:hypothetical protein